MLKQKYNEASYMVTDHLDGQKMECAYLVTLQHLNNDANGCPRYEARIVNLDVAGSTSITGFAAWAYIYRFSGHYREDLWEAKWIVEEHIKRMAAQ